MMLTPSFWSKEMPETSSKQTTSYWQTRPRCPEALLTNILATVALPPEIRCEYGEICWNRWMEKYEEAEAVLVEAEAALSKVTTVRLLVEQNQLVGGAE